MPRSDGLPTNREMMADFAEVSRQFFVAALHSQSENGFDPSLLGKPLPLLRIFAYHKIDEADTSALAAPFTAERLEVNALGENDSEPVPGNHPFDEIPQHIRRYRRELRKPISETNITEGLDVSGLIVPGTIVAGYEAYGRDRKRLRSTHTWDHRPIKANIVTATHLAEEALKHVARFGTSFENPEDLTAHEKPRDYYVAYIGLSMVPELPLNGYESRDFLKNYSVQMMLIADRAAIRIERSKTEIKPDFLVDKDNDIYVRATAALMRAQDLLDS